MNWLTIILLIGILLVLSFFDCIAARVRGWRSKVRGARVRGACAAGAAAMLLLLVGGCGTTDFGLSGNPIQELLSDASDLTNSFHLGTFNADEICSRAKSIKGRTDKLVAIAAGVMSLNPDPQTRAYYDTVKAGKAVIDAALASVCNWSNQLAALTNAVPVVPPAAESWEPYYTKVYRLYFQAPGSDQVAVPTNAAVFWLPEYVSKTPPAPPEIKPIYVDPAKIMEQIKPVPNAATNTPNPGTTPDPGNGPDPVTDPDTAV